VILVRRVPGDPRVPLRAKAALALLWPGSEAGLATVLRLTMRAENRTDVLMRQ
jgi:hypothetical protein